MGHVEPGPVASIVVTNHDYGRFVGDAIESALGQTVPCQVIVVDDGSTDDSLAVIGRFGERVEVVAKANGGQASAFNAGFARCRTPVVLFLDGDDRLAAGAVEAVVGALDREPEAARCHFGLAFIDADGAAMPGGLPEAGRQLPRGDLLDRLTTSPDDIAWQPTSGNAFRAGVLADLLPMPTEPYRISADHYLSNLSALHGPVLAIDRPLASYRIHGANADHRVGFELARARSILTRTSTTRAELIAHGRELGVTMPSGPDGFRSLTNDAMRLVSARLARSTTPSPGTDHPFPEDRRRDLLARGIRSAIGRSDLPPHRRALAVAWVLALGLAPTALLPSIASRGLTR